MIDILVIWYCRGCKRTVEQSVETGQEVVKCPHCGTEKKRTSE